MFRILFVLLAVCVTTSVMADATPNPNVPVEYTQLEYIETTGAQWIDSGVMAADDVGLAAEFYKMTTGDQVVMGGVSSAGQSVSSVYINPAVSLLFAWNGWGRMFEQNSTFKTQLNTWYDAKLNFYNDRKTFIDGVQYHNLDVSLGASEPYNIYMFALWWGDTNTVSNYFIGRVRSMQITKGDHLIRDLVPVRRNSDGESGLYDIVNGMFYVSQGSENFIPSARVAGLDGNNNLVWVCDAGLAYNSLGGCSQLCLAGITTLNTSTGIIAPLFATANTSPALHIKNDKGTCHADLIPGTGQNAIHIRYDGQVYHTMNINK